MRKHFCLFLLASIFYSYATLAQNASAKNPVVHADVPDMSMIRVGDTYYMSSTTMHMAPGVPDVYKRQFLLCRLSIIKANS